MIKSILILAVCVLIPGPLAQGGGETEGLAVRAGKLVTMDDRDTVINGAVVLIKEGIFEALGSEDEIAIPEGYKVIDATDRWVCPGLVDYHSHIGGSLGDLNDGVYLTNPGLRMDECFKPDNPALRDAKAAGVTTLLVIPGSGVNHTGLGAMYKSGGRTFEDSKIANPGCVKIAQAGNPERYWFRVGRTFMNWNLSYVLKEMKAYHETWCAYERGETREKPEKILAYEPYRDFYRGHVPTCMHTQAYQVCLRTFTMMHDEFGFWTVPTHSTFDAYKLASLAAERSIVIIAGPRNIYMDRNECRINGVAAKWAEGGVEDLGTETDAPVVPIEEHTYQAALASRMGWEPYAALKGLCRATAKGAMLDDRVGSVEKGKDGDLSIWSGDPLDPRSMCSMTIVNGRVIYDVNKDGQRF